MHLKIQSWFKYGFVDEMAYSGLHRNIPWLHRHFTGIYRVLPCQTVARPARAGATSALPRETPLPNRQSTYQTWAHITSVLLWFHSVVLRWRGGACTSSYIDCSEQTGVDSQPGAPRLFYKFENHRGHCPLIAGSTRFIFIYCGASRRRYEWFR